MVHSGWDTIKLGTDYDIRTYNGLRAHFKDGPIPLSKEDLYQEYELGKLLFKDSINPASKAKARIESLKRNVQKGRVAQREYSIIPKDHSTNQRELLRFVLKYAQKSAKRRRIIILETLLGKTLAAIGRKLGLTRERIRQLRDKAFEDIKKEWYLHLEKQG